MGVGCWVSGGCGGESGGPGFFPPTITRPAFKPVMAILEGLSLNFFCGLQGLNMRQQVPALWQKIFYNHVMSPVVLLKSLFTLYVEVTSSTRVD